MMRWLLRFLVVLLSGQAMAQTPAPASPRYDPAAWSLADCRSFGLQVAEGRVDCGYVTVPRRHEHPAGPAIRRPRSPAPRFPAWSRSPAAATPATCR